MPHHGGLNGQRHYKTDVFIMREHFSIHSFRAKEGLWLTIISKEKTKTFKASHGSIFEIHINI